ncbi:MAG: lamin tail domain-containing protein [archaeon]
MNTIKICFCTLLFLVMFFGSVNALIVINEVELNPPSQYDDDEWIELYNTGDYPEDISGYTLTDGGGMVDTIPSGTIIGPGEFFVFTEDISGLSLDNADESITLNNSFGQIEDVTPTLIDSANNLSTWQRIPDGDNNWQFLEGTAGASNGGDGGNGGIPEFPAFIVPVLLMFAGVSVARRYGGLYS